VRESEKRERLAISAAAAAATATQIYARNSTHFFLASHTRKKTNTHKFDAALFLAPINGLFKLKPIINIDTIVFK